MNKTKPALVKVEDPIQRKELIDFLSTHDIRHVLFSARYNYGVYIKANYYDISSSDNPIISDDFVDCGTDIEKFKKYIKTK
ncbi:MAG: hypothetical protein M0R46_06260 [Candidatus Muirbacterium halophilum]|nr:hypothetical protein [Candidatus Muirbacterium halophilum]